MHYSRKKGRTNVKIRRFFIRYCDQLTRIQFWLAMVAAALVGGGSGILFGAHESEKVADKRVAEVQAINLSLIQTLQNQMRPLVEKQAEVAEQQSAASEKLEQTTDRVQMAATTASRAASQAGRAARKFREPVGSIRQVPARPVKPRCRGKDVFGDPCP